MPNGYSLALLVWEGLWEGELGTGWGLGRAAQQEVCIH